jgi:predicted extracellular nuclease
MPRTLRFGEYVEGSGSYKALELAGTPEAALDGCRLVTYSNGSTTGSGIALSGALSAVGAYTLCSSSLTAVLGTTCDRTTNLSMNGNDAVLLECDGAVMDAIGQIGFDPGTAWTGASGSTANATLRLRCDTEPDRDPTDAFDPDERWLTLPIDTFEGLGDPICG